MQQEINRLCFYCNHLDVVPQHIPIGTCAIDKYQDTHFCLQYFPLALAANYNE